MKPGVSISETIGSACASQSCMKRAALSAASASMAPPRCAGSLARTPTGRPSTRASAVTMPAPKPRSQLERRVAIDKRRDHRAHVVDAQPVRRQQLAQRVSDRPQPARRGTAAEESEDSGAPRRPPSASSSTSTSITPARDCTSLGPISSGRNAPRPPPSIIAGPPMPIELSRVAMMTSQQPSSAALPAKQRPATMPTSGTRPLRRAKLAKVVHVQAGDDRHVDVARPAAAALGEQHHRQPLARRDGEQAIGLLVVAHALRAGEHGRVVGHDDGARARRRRSRSRSTLPMPVTMPSAGVLRIRSSSSRRPPLRRVGEAPYSTKLPHRTDRRCSRARCAGRAHGAARRRRAGLASASNASRARNSSRSARKRCALGFGHGRAAPVAPARLISTGRTIASTSPSATTSATLRAAHRLHHAVRPGDAPRAPSSSTRRPRRVRRRRRAARFRRRPRRCFPRAARRSGMLAARRLSSAERTAPA